MAGMLRIGAVSIALLSLVLSAFEVGARTIRVDRNWATIGGAMFANDGFVESEIFAVEEVPPNGDRVQRPFSINFFGTVYDRLYINENGVISFGEELPDPPGNVADVFTAGIPVIVPFFADADMGTAGQVNIAFTFGTNMFINMSSTYQGAGVAPFPMNFMQVAFFGSQTSTDFTLELNYDVLAWESGNLDGGTNGLGGNFPPRIGFSDGFGRVYEVPGSGMNGVLLGSAFQTPCPPGSLSVACNDYFFQFRNGLPFINDVPIFPVAEPGSTLLLLTGLGLLAALRRRHAAGPAS